MTQLDDVVSFVDKGAVNGAAVVTVKHIEDARRLSQIAEGVTNVNRILVMTGRGSGFDSGILRYSEDYQCYTDFDTEANLVLAKEGLITNIDKCNRREAITSYTKPSKLINITLIDWSDPKFFKQAGRIRNDFTLRIEWSTA